MARTKFTKLELQILEALWARQKASIRELQEAFPEPRPAYTTIQTTVYRLEGKGAVRRVRTFGPIQRAEVALSATGGETVIEIDAPRDRELQIGDVIGLQPRRYRIFAAQD